MDSRAAAPPAAQLHVLTDSVPVALAALRAGAHVVQVRAPDLADRALLELAATVAEAARQRGAWCIVDDRVDVALAVGATGVHLGPTDLPVDVARRLLGPGAVIGASARTVEAARAAVAAGATYLGVGPCFATSSKPGLPDPIGPAGLAEVAAAVEVPAIAIGGVQAATVPDVLAAGAAGVAVIGAVSGAEDPAGATTALLGALQTGTR